jgi:hypothetical protein
LGHTPVGPASAIGSRPLLVSSRGVIL